MDCPIIVGGGPATRAGGVDLFLELAVAVNDFARAEFVWIAARPRAIAQRLDAELESLGDSVHVEWRPLGGAPVGPGVVLAVTARTVDAAQSALAEVAAGTPVVGFASDPSVGEVLRRAGASTTRYPDITTLAERALAASLDQP